MRGGAGWLPSVARFAASGRRRVWLVVVGDMSSQRATLVTPAAEMWGAVHVAGAIGDHTRSEAAAFAAPRRDAGDLELRRARRVLLSRGAGMQLSLCKHTWLLGCGAAPMGADV